MMKFLLGILLTFLTFQIICASKLDQNIKENDNLFSHQAVSRMKRNFSSIEPDLNELLVNRINDKLMVTLEYRLSKMEADRTELLRADIRDLSRRVQNLNWENVKIENSLEQLRGDIESLRLAKSSPEDLQNTQLSSEIHEKFDNMATLMSSTKITVQRIDRELLATKRNISFLLLTAKDINHTTKTLPSKQYFNNALLSLKSQPVYAMMHQNEESSRTLKSIQNLNACTLPTSGIQKMQSNFKNPYYVYCDMETEEGGWIVIQKRSDGSVDFFRNWLEYVHGFGNVAGEYWIGLEKIHDLTSLKLHELLIVLEDFEGTKAQALYSVFGISGESNFYSLNMLGKYSGNAGDSLSSHAGQKFSTYDLDNDSWIEGNCAKSHFGGWWYNSCDTSNLNGKYLSGSVADEQKFQGMHWTEFGGPNYSLKSVKMMIRPIE